MSLSQNATALKLALSRANLQSLTPMLQTLGFGDVIRSMTTNLYGRAPLAVAGYGYIVQTGAQALALPDDAKALVIDYAYGRKGTATSAVLTVDASAATAPNAGHCKVGPSGDILFNSTDAWTSVDVIYRPRKQDVAELVLPAVASVVTLPTTQNGIAALYTQLMESEAKAGTVVGKNVIQPDGAAPATTTWANLSVDHTTVLYDTADAPTNVRVKVGLAPKIDVDALLEAACNFI